MVDQGALVTLRFDRPLRPTSISASRRQTSTSPPLETFAVPADNPTQFRVDFPPGTHIVTMFTVWPQGDALYVFEVTVRPANALSSLFRETICPVIQPLHASFASVPGVAAALTPLLQRFGCGAPSGA